MRSTKICVTLLCLFLATPGILAHAQDDGQFEAAISFKGQTLSVPGTLGVLRLVEDCDPARATKAGASTFMCQVLDGVRYEDPDAPGLSLTLYDTSFLPSNSTDARIKDFTQGIQVLQNTLQGSSTLANYGAHVNTGNSLPMQYLPPFTRATSTIAITDPRVLKDQNTNVGVTYVAVDTEGANHRLYMDFLFFLPNTRILGVYTMPLVEANSNGQNSFDSYLSGKVTGLTDLEKTLQIGDTLQNYVSTKVAGTMGYSTLYDAVNSMLSSAKATPFIDVFPSTAYAEAILSIRSAGIIQGYADGSFKPTKPVNRAEFMKILLEASGAKNLEGFAKACFPDVDASQWYAKYVCYGKEKGIIAGYNDGSFRPEATINLAEGLKIVFNSYNINVGTGGGEWYQPYLDEARKRGMLVLVKAQVGDNLSRGEMAELMYRLLNS